jgi:hypothetical protein
VRTFIQLEIRKLFSHFEFRVLLIASSLAAVLGMLENVILFLSTDVSSLKPAFRMGMVYDGTFGYLFMAYLLPLFVSVAYADSYFTERQSGVDVLQFARTKRRMYVSAKAIVAAASGFFLVIWTFVLNQVFCLLAFPWRNHNSFFGDAYAIGGPLPDIYLQRALFPNLSINFPYVDNLAHIGIAGVWGAVMALLTYCISFYLRKNRIVVVGATTVVTILFYFIGDNLSPSLTITNYIQAVPITVGLRLETFMLVCAVAVSLCAGSLWYQSRGRLDDLR